MPLTRPLLIKRRPLKLIPATDNPKSIEFSPRYTTHNKADSTLALYYKTKVTS
jgi:hypothetical protein